MTTGRLGRALAAGTVGLFAGCVDRRFVVDANVPGAQISVDGKPIGPSPADDWYTYAGDYEFRAVAPGYAPLTKVVKLKPKWYDYPGLDFVAECLWPFRIEDVRHVRLELEPARPVRTDELLDAANRLRDRGQNLPPSQVPDDDLGPATGREVTPPKVITPGPQLQGPQLPTVPTTSAAPAASPSPSGYQPSLPGPGTGYDPSAVFAPPSAPAVPQPGVGVVPEIGTYNR